MAEDLYPVIDFRTATMNLARCLSSPTHFLPAAHQLLTCEHLSSEDIDRHSRKIVTLIEIARSTLSRSHVRLHLFASCNPALAHHKEAYLNLLRMLRRLRPHMTESSLDERICRLLLSLSTSMHMVTAADAGDQATASCSAAACRESLLSPRSPSPPPVTVSYPPAHPRRPPEDHAMLPPDVLLARPKKRVPYRERTPQPEPEAPPRGRRSRRLEDRPFDEHMSIYDGIRELPAYVPKPVRRFGILFTMRRPHQRHHR